MKICLTGATGFVGRNVVPRLASQGHDLSVLVRHGSVTGTLPDGAVVVRGDVRDGESMSRFVKECDVVVHVSGSHGEDEPETVETGTRAIASAASEAGVQRFIFLSSLPAHAASKWPVYRAMWRAEQSVRGSGILSVILRPSLVLGRGDGVTRPLADVIRALPVIPIPGSGRQRHQPIDVDDLAECIVRAVSMDLSESREVAVGGPLYLTLRQLVDLIQGALGSAKAKVFVPDMLLPRVAALVPPSARPLFAGSRLAMLEETSVASPGIVEREFGFTPQSVVERIGGYV